MRFAPVRLFWLVVGSVMGAVLLAGCFQTAGEPLPPTATGGVAPAAVPTQEPVLVITNTQPPLAQPTTPVPVLPTQTPAELPPTDVIPGLSEGQTEGGLAAGETPSEAIPPIEATSPFGEGVGGLEPTGVAVAQDFTATPTSTTFVLPTATPTVPLGTGALTATAIIAERTATVAANQTASATALGTFVPSETPTPTATLPPGVTPPSPTPGGDCVHVVQRGETAYGIARRYGVTLAQIAQANNVTNLSILSIGQPLVIPGCGTTGITPVPGLPSGLPPSPSSGRIHVIQPGENLYRIALRYGVTVAALANANGIANINYIRAGDTLVIP